MKLHVFIIKSGVPNISLEKVKDSFGDEMELIVEHIENNYAIINRTEKKADWYAVIYDNEYVDIFLAEGLHKFLALTPNDALGIYRKIDSLRASRSVRFYKSHVKIHKDRLVPADESVEVDYMLNGWFLQYDPD